MATYSYKFENDVYRLYEDDQPMSTSQGHPIMAEDETLAQKLVEDLRRGKTFASNDSLLAYHYTYCNMIVNHTLDELVTHYSENMNYANLIDDRFLMFRQSAPVRQAVASYFAENAKEFFRSMNYYQFAAFTVMGTYTDSWILPYMLIVDIIEQMDESDYVELKEAFMNDLMEYEHKAFGCDAEDVKYKGHLSEFSRAIDLFVEYFTIN